MNQVCGFGYGDAGFGYWGYYILDPNRKYILSISHWSENMEDFEPSEILYPNVKTIVKSVKFTQ